MTNVNFSSKLVQVFVILTILNIKLAYGASGPHTVVVTFEPDTGASDITVEADIADFGSIDGTDEDHLHQKCNRYVTNIGRAVDMALVTVHVIGDKETKAWQAFSRLNGRLTQMENHLDDINARLNHATKSDSKGRGRELCDAGCYYWCNVAPQYCWCYHTCRRRRNLRRELALPDDQDLEDLEIAAENEVSKQLSRWNKEITCIKRKWDDKKSRWDYSESVNVEIFPANVEDNDVDIKKRRKHNKHKKRKKEQIKKEMRKKIKETQKAIRAAERKLRRALKEEKDAEEEAAAAYVDFEDIKEDHANDVGCMPQEN